MTLVHLGSQTRDHPDRNHADLTRNRWGYLRVGYARHWVQHRLVMHPPGATVEDRLAVRMWTSARLWAPAVWLAIFACAGAAGDPKPLPVLIATAATVLLVVSASIHAWRPWRRLRVMVSWTGTGCSVDDVERHLRLSRIVTMLERADDDLLRGAITAVEHEVIWGRCYSELA